MSALIPSGMEIWIVLGIALLLFGHRIPGMARALGSGIVEFKRGLKGEPDDGQPPEKLPPSSSSSQAASPQETQKQQS